MRLSSAPLRSGFNCWLWLLAVCMPVLTHGQTDGARKWTFATLSSFTQGNILSSPSVAPDGTVYVGVEVGLSSSPTPGGRLFALTPSGTQKWVFSTPDWIDSAPAIATDGTVYVGCWDGKLYAINPNGSQKWAVSLGSYVSGSPAIGADGTIYVGTGNGNLYAVSPNGTTKWFFPTLYWIEGSPAIAPDGTIYIGSDDNTLYAVTPDGREKWRYSAGNDIASSPAIAADGTIYVGSRDLKLHAVTPAGAAKWTFETTDMIDASPVIGPDGTVYVATTGGRLYALRTDGTVKWQYPAAAQAALGSIYSTPAVRADGSLVFGSDSAVYALRADGTLLWKSTVGDWADSSPAIATDGSIYIGCTDKSVYAFSGTVGPLLSDWPQFLRDPQRTGLQPLGAVAGTTGRLTNLSVRTTAGTNENTLIVGYSIGGAGSRNLLVRGVGPTLSTFGVSGVLSDPLLRIIPLGQSAPTATNNNWGDTNKAAIASAAASLGAFSLPDNSLDSAILTSFAVSGQTAQVTGNDGGTGIALVELYDNGGSSTARLTNVSARSLVGTGSGVLIAGFVVSGGTRAILVRGIGPTLGSFGVSGVLANPQLRVYNAQNVVVAENDDWSVATNASTVSARGSGVGAFALTSGSKDAAMLLTLPPGNYTAQVSGVANTTGVALIEVYELP